MGFASYAVALWNVLETSRRSEAEARTLAERKREEAEAAGAARSLYVATIGHELRTPISAMLAGSIELERAAKGSNLKAHATLIADAGRMMKTLLDDVLDPTPSSTPAACPWRQVTFASGPAQPGRARQSARCSGPPKRAQEVVFLKLRVEGY